MNYPLYNALEIVLVYIYIFSIIFISWFLFFGISKSPRSILKDLLEKRNYTSEQAKEVARKDVNEIQKILLLHEENETKRKENFQIYCLLLNEKQVTKKTELFRESGYKLKEKDKEMIKKIEQQYTITEVKNKL